MRASVRTVLIGIWAAALLIGGYAVSLRLTDGHRPAAYGSYIVWGLGVAQYIYFVGISAGSFLLAALYYGFGMQKLAPVARPALLTAFAGLVAGLVSIWLDLGHMGRAFSVLIRPNFTSMMAWMIWLYAAYGILLLVTLYLAYKKSAGVKLAALVGTPLVIGFSGGVGALFATVEARALWNSGLYPVFFVVGGVLSAGGLLLAMLARREKQTPDLQAAIGTLSKLVLGLLLVEVLLEWAEYSVGLWYGIGGEHAAVQALLFGTYWWVFWLVHVAMGVMVPAYLLWRQPGSAPAQGFAGLLVVVTYLAVRLNLVIPGQVTPEMKGLEMAYTGTRLVYQYSPSAFEWGLFIFTAALAVGLLWAANRYLPEGLKAEKEEKAA